MDDPGGHPFGLCPIQIADAPYFNQVFANVKQALSDYSFANTFIWGTSLKLYWRRCAQHLCVFANGTGDLTMLMPPLPEPGAAEGQLDAALDECFHVMDAYNLAHTGSVGKSRIEYVSDEQLERLSATALKRQLNLGATPMGGDYVYDMARMIDLAGGDLKSKRHARGKFMRDFPAHRADELTSADVPACLDLLHQWQHARDGDQAGVVSDNAVATNVLRGYDVRACELALAHYQELGMRGMVLRVGDRLAGFTLGQPISASQVSILIEKTHPDFANAPQFIFSEFCRRFWSAYPECNAGDDWGIPSLRWTKLSYRPVRVLSKYVVTRVPATVVHPPVLTPNRAA